MKPKKIQHILEETYKKLPLDESMIEDVVRFYWKEGVYADIEKLSHFTIHVPKIGNFEIIRKNITSMINYYIKKNSPHENEQLRLERLKELQQKLLKDYERRNSIREKKKKYLEEQKQNP